MSQTHKDIYNDYDISLKKKESFSLKKRSPMEVAVLKGASKIKVNDVSADH